jgi:hypothetical protein
MHALDQVAHATARARYNQWARELAQASVAFVHGPPGQRRMYWKMSIDLTRPLVTSMGHHDALDGWITLVQLRTSASLLAGEVGEVGEPNLAHEIKEFAAMSEGGDWATSDALGIGGLLSHAVGVEQLLARGAFFDESLLEALLAAALRGLSGYTLKREVERPATRRLAFREFGLAIGLSGAVGLHGRGRRVSALLAELAEHAPLVDDIRSFWLAPESRRVASWLEHRDINEVMLATSLLPDGYASRGG